MVGFGTYFKDKIDMIDDGFGSGTLHNKRKNGLQFVWGILVIGDLLMQGMQRLVLQWKNKTLDILNLKCLLNMYVDWAIKYLGLRT